MCGIVGIYAFENLEPNRKLWVEMVNHLYHRGPDEGALWFDNRFFLGHRRLAIIDLEAGHQPMGSADGNLVVTFNGEIYNFLELKRRLTTLGYQFRTQSDTEVLLHGYHAWGDELPKYLRGMFAFAIADRVHKRLFLARDRFGEKPLFFLEASDFIAFASELRPLAALPGLAREMDHEALGGFLSLNYVPGGRTLMKGIRRVLPGQWIRFEAAKERRSEFYWSLPVDQAASGKNRWASKSAIREEWDSHFDRAVKLAMTSDVPVGILLSGGVDSSLVAESASRQGSLSNAYFLDFDEASFSEYGAASEVATKLGIPLERVVLTSAALQDFFAIVEHADEPLADSSCLAMWTLARFAQQKNKVVLGGDGGDELFGGYLTYRASHYHRSYVSRLPMQTRRSLARLAIQIPISEGKVSSTYKLWRFLRAADLPTHLAHFTWNGTWLPDEAKQFVKGDVVQQVVGKSLSELAERHRCAAEPDFFSLQHADLADYLPNDILAKADRMSMAHGLEVRAPFLDTDFSEWAIQLPLSQKIGSGGQGKVLPREMVRRRFGPTLSARGKQGFSIPIHAWVRGPFAEVVQDLLSRESLARIDVLDSERIQVMLQKHFSGARSFGFELWGLAVLVAWHRTRIERQPLPPRDSPVVFRVMQSQGDA